MATARMENVGPVVMGISKQNGQLKGQPKPASQSGSMAPSNPFGKVGAQKQAADSREGPGIRCVPRHMVKNVFSVILLLIRLCVPGTGLVMIGRRACSSRPKILE